MFNKRLIGLIKGSMGYVIRNVCMQWLALCCNIAIMMAAARLMGSALADGIAGPSAEELQTVFSPLRLAAYAGIIALCILLRFLFTRLAARFSHLSSEGVKSVLRRRIYEKMLLLGPGYQQHVGTSEVLQVAVEGVEQLEIYFGKYLPQLFYSLLAPVTLFIALGFMDMATSAVLLAFVPLIPVSIMLVQKFAKKLVAKYWGKYTAMGDSFLENLQGLATLKIFGSDGERHKRMNEQAEDFRRVTMKVLTMQLNSVTLMDLMAYGGAAVGIITAINRYASGYIPFEACMSILLLASEFFIPMRALGSYFHVAMNGSAAADKIFELLDTPVPAGGRQDRLDINRGIAMQNVSYSYDGKRSVLKGINLVAGRGITAVVGESGSGKSTIAALLSGSMRGYKGSISIGGVDAGDISAQALANTITLVPHNAYIFKGSVRDNLRMADGNATDKQMWAALERACLAGYLAGAKGLDTMLAEQGSNLSGGQRQRLALARALLHDTPVYIFDEATSNIDVESENDITSAIWAMGKSKTVILITHRLAGAVTADRIYAMAGGQIVESGRHGQLLTKNGLYARMYNAQQQLERPAETGAAYVTV